MYEPTPHFEIRLTTVDRLDEALSLPCRAIGLGQEGCVAKLPEPDVLRRTADRVRSAGKTVTFVAPIAWPRHGSTVTDLAVRVAADGPVTVAVNDIGTLLDLTARGVDVVVGLGLTRARAHSAAADVEPTSVADVTTLEVLGDYGVTGIEVDSLTDVTPLGPEWRIRELVSTVPVAYGRSCPIARAASLSPPHCRTQCDTPVTITPSARWQLNHGYREPLPAGVATNTLTVWGNAVYDESDRQPRADYRILDARRWSPAALRELFDVHTNHDQRQP